MKESEVLGWCILELMGHRKMAGYVQEAEIAGGKFLRIDVPGPKSEGIPPHEEKAVATQYYSPASVYAITPTTESLAREIAIRNQPAPVARWELPEAKTAPATDEHDYPPDNYPL